MGTMPVTKLILTMSLPMMFSMFIQALYNIVDSIFIAKISEDALTAVSIAFPIQNLMISVAVGTGVGVNSLLSMRLGQKRQDDVNKAAMNGLFLALCSYAAFFIVGLTCLRVYLTTQTDNPRIIEYGMDYLTIVTLASFGMFVGIMLDRLLQATGRTIYTMFSQLAGAVFNIIFDPLLIFGVGPFPEMGIQGAALATVLGQFFGMFVSLFCNIRKNEEVQLRFRTFRPDGAVIRQIYKVGVPSILLSSVTSVTTYFIDIVLGKFSTTAIAVYGVYFKLNSFIFMPVFGLNNGIVPIVAYNYGARNHRRITRTIRTAAVLAVAIMTVGSLIFELFPRPLLRLFDASEAMLAIGIPAMRIIAASFISAAITITLSSVFQAFGNAFYSMAISFARQLLVLLPSVYLLSLTGNINNVWWAFLIAELVSFSLSCVFMRSVYNSKIKPIPIE